MRRPNPLYLIFVIMALAPSNGWAEEPQKKPGEFVPPPPQMIVPQPVPQMFIVPEMPRTDTRQVWSYYGVDSLGRFRPRVILAPYGSYYMSNGEPYPWVNSRSGRIMPYALD